MEPYRFFDLRRVTQIRKLNQRAVRDQRRSPRTQHTVITNDSLNSRGRPSLTDGSVVLVTNHQQRAGLYQTELIDDGLRINHIRGLGLVPRELGTFAAVVDVGQHRDPHIVFRFPGVDIVSVLLVGHDGSRGGGVLSHPAEVDALVRNAQGLPVLQAEWVDHDQRRHVARVHESVARSQHPPCAVADDGRVVNAQLFQQAVCVQSELLKGELVPDWLGGFAPSDLVRCDDAIADVGELVYCLVPGGAAEVLAVEEDGHFFGGGDGAVAGWANIHEGHFDVHLLGGESVDIDWIRICEV